MNLKPYFENSIFYPCSGLDGYSLRLANLHKTNLNIQNHVLVDYSISRESFLEEIQKIRGYDIVESIELTQQSLAPNGWQQLMPPMLNLNTYQTEITRWRAKNNPFAFLTKLKRNESFDTSHGPTDLNIIFIKGEAIATYSALKQNWDFSPTVTIFKSAGWGWGLGYEDFREPNNSLEWILRNNLQNRKMQIATDEQLLWNHVTLVEEIAVPNSLPVRIYSI